MKVTAFLFAFLCSLESGQAFISPVQTVQFPVKESRIKAAEYDLDVAADATDAAVAAVADVTDAAVAATSGLGFDPVVIGAAVVVLGLGAFFATQGGNGEPAATKAPKKVEEVEPEPIDVSIPYDAAALLAYEEWKAQYEEADELDDEEFFPKFKTLYTDFAVAEVVQKSKARNFAALSAGMTLKAPEETADEKEPFFLS